MNEHFDEGRNLFLRELFAAHGRVVIVGGPRTGKTRLADLVDDRVVIRTDDSKRLPWEDVPAALITQCTPLERFVVEGVQVARALRKGLEVDAVLYLDSPRAEQSKGQAAMSKAVATVFGQWRAKNLQVHVVSPGFPF